ncbi:hypothetical protein SCA6_017534 [Theobroma cacao]
MPKLTPNEANSLDMENHSWGQNLQEMMFDQRQKQLGLPTSEEIEKQEMLKKFMAQNPNFDFSSAKMM